MALLKPEAEPVVAIVHRAQHGIWSAAQPPPDMPMDITQMAGSIFAEIIDLSADAQGQQETARHHPAAPRVSGSRAPHSPRQTGPSVVKPAPGLIATGTSALPAWGSRG